MYEVADKTVLQKVNRRLGTTGTASSSHVTADVRKGEVTLSGTLQYENQRRPLIRATSTVEGVRRVIDRLRVVPKKREW